MASAILPLLCAVDESPRTARERGATRCIADGERWLATVSNERKWRGERRVGTRSTAAAVERGLRSERRAALLVGVTFQPSRLGLPVRQGRVIISDWHLDLRQTLGVEYQVLR